MNYVNDNYIFNQLLERTGSAFSYDVNLDEVQDFVVDATPTLVKASGGNLFGFILRSTNTDAIFAKFYDSISPTVGTSEPKFIIAIPPATASSPSQVVANPKSMPFCSTFSNGISVACVTSDGIAGDTSPSVDVYGYFLVG